MTDLIETIARAMRSMSYADASDAGRSALILTAINEAGYAVVPREPTEAMTVVGGRICADLSSGRASQPYEDDAREAYRAMIAATTTGEQGNG